MRLLFSSIHCYLDPSSGAALCTRELLELLAGRGMDCRALTAGILDHERETPLDEVLASLELPALRCQAGLTNGGSAEVIDLTVNGVRVTLLPTASSRAERSPDPRESAVFLNLADQVLDRFRPDVLLTYGGHPACLALMRRARARGIAVVFHLHNFGYNDRRAFADASAVIFPSEYSRRHHARLLGLDGPVIPDPIPLDRIVAEHPEPTYATFINPQPAKGAAVFVRIALELNRRRPEIPLLVVEGRGTSDALARLPVDLSGLLTNVRDSYANLTFTYDSGGNMLTAATSGPGTGQPSVTLTSGYDQFHDRTSLVDDVASNVGRTTFAYDAAFRLTSIAASYNGASGPQVVLGYDAGNRETSISRTIGGAGTAVNTTIVYDAANRLGTITHQTGGGTALATYVYGYDNADRVTTEVNAEGTVTYSYDSGGELLTARGSRTETYSYDSGGNRTMTGYTTGTGNELTASPGTTYTYDNEGNLSAQSNTSTHVVTSYTYDNRNRLTQVTVGGTIVATYTYDALDRRIGFKDNGTQTWTVYDGQNPYADFNSSGTLLTRYVYGPALDELFARTSSGGTSAWYLPDRMGTVRDIANTSGTVIDHVVYDSYGNVTSESNSANGDRFKFTGREYDTTSAFYYYRARYFGPATGRFLRLDPLGFGSGDINLYRYVGNSPNNSADPTGLLPPFNPGSLKQISPPELDQQGNDDMEVTKPGAVEIPIDCMSDTAVEGEHTNHPAVIFRPSVPGTYPVDFVYFPPNADYPTGCVKVPDGSMVRLVRMPDGRIIPYEGLVVGGPQIAPHIEWTPCDQYGWPGLTPGWVAPQAPGIDQPGNGFPAHPSLTVK